MQELQSSSGTQSGGSTRREARLTQRNCRKEDEREQIDTTAGVFSDLRIGRLGPWLPIQMRKWSPDRGRSLPARHCAAQALLVTTEEETGRVSD